MVEPRIDNGSYCVDDEPDALRAGVHIVGDLLASALIASHRRDDTAKALKAGSTDHLYVWERSAIEWLIAQIERDGGVVLNAWVYDLVRRVCEKRGAIDAT